MLTKSQENFNKNVGEVYKKQLTGLGVLAQARNEAKEKGYSNRNNFNEEVMVPNDSRLLRKERQLRNEVMSEFSEGKF